MVSQYLDWHPTVHTRRAVICINDPQPLNQAAEAGGAGLYVHNDRNVTSAT